MLTMYPSRMVNTCQTILKDTIGRFHAVAAIGDALMRSQRTVNSLIRAGEPNIFRDTYSLVLQLGVAEYTLPIQFAPNGVLEVVRTQGGISWGVRYTPWSNRYNFQVGDYVWTVRHDGHQLKITIVPTPSTVETFTVHYQRNTVPMQYGTVASATGTSLRLPASPTMGRTYFENDNPIGAWALITAGTGSNQIRQITAYNAGTRVATVSTWGTIPASSSTCEVIDFIDDDYADAIVYDAVSEALMRDEEDPSAWVQKRDQHIKHVIDSTKRLQKRQPGQLMLDRNINRTRRIRGTPNDYAAPWGAALLVSALSALMSGAHLLTSIFA